MDWITPVAIIVSLLLVGFFAGIEIAFVSANKLSVELRKKQGTQSGKIWGEYMDNPVKFIGITLIGFNLLLVIYGLAFSKAVHAIWDLSFWKKFNTENPYLRLLFETVTSTFFLLLFLVLFMAFFRIKNEAILGSRFITGIVKFFYKLFSGIAVLFVDMAEWILKYVFNVKINTKKDAISKVDLEHFINHNKHYEEKNTPEINKELFENALSLSEIRLKECLVPRKEIEAVDIKTSIGEIKNIFIKTKLSKLVVYEDNIDSIVGYIHQLALFKNPTDIKSVLLPIPVVPSSMSAIDLMNKFSKERKSIAWVVDEFGGTAGIVTMEDLLEEIFGEIKDEYDVEELIEKQISANEFIFSGRLELDYISEKYKIDFHDREDAETLSGFIIQSRDEIPKQKETIIVENYQFDIINVSDTRIETVKMKVLD